MSEGGTEGTEGRGTEEGREAGSDERAGVMTGVSLSQARR